jgi:hypothetical protein
MNVSDLIRKLPCSSLDRDTGYPGHAIFFAYISQLGLFSSLTKSFMYMPISFVSPKLSYPMGIQKYQGLFPRQYSNRVVKLTTHFHLVPRLRLH